MHEPDANRLHASSVLPLGGRKRDSARHEDAGEIAAAGQRHHHRGEALVARCDAEHAAARRERSDQSSEHRRGIVAERQTVEHRGRALGSAVARVGTRRRERHGAGLPEHVRGRFNEQPDFPVSRVIAERDWCAVGGANATVRGQHQELPATERGGIPAHSRVLAPAEQVTGREFAQHLGGERQGPGGTSRTRRDVENRRIVGVERIDNHGPIISHGTHRERDRHGGKPRITRISRI